MRISVTCIQFTLLAGQGTKEHPARVGKVLYMMPGELHGCVTLPCLSDCTTFV